MTELTQKSLKLILNYNESTGAFSRINRNGKCGCLFEGYVRIKVLGKQYKAHRLAFLYVHGYIPSIIDHLDGNGENNEISNLRPATSSLNGKNQRLSRANKSGVCGVRYKKNPAGWVATSWANGKSVHLKFTSDFFEAVCARKSYDSKNGFTKRHGSRE